MPRKRKPVPKLHVLVGAQRKERGVRRCVRCNREFSSRSRGNRICGRCKRILGDTKLPVTYRSELNEPE